MWGRPPGASPRWRRRPSRRPAGRSSSTTARRTSFSSRSRSTCSRSRPSGGRSSPSSGVKRLGELARLPGAAVADRLGADGAEAWQLARGEGDASVEPRRPPAEIAETLSFPEPVANELTLARALAALIERLLARPERAGRAPRQLALSAKLVGGGSWRRSLTLREPTAEPDRLRLALASKLAELPAPTVELRLELGELTESVGTQAELIRPRGSRSAGAPARGAPAGARGGGSSDAVCTVVEVAPWSRIPETRAILVPRDD